jgi:hypothetical protein
MGKAIRISTLILLLTCSAQAGWMMNGLTEPPPPPPVEQEMTRTAQGPAEGGDTEDEATHSLTQTVLELLAGVFSLP